MLNQTIDDSFDVNELTCDTSLLTEFTCTQNEDEAEEEKQNKEKIKKKNSKITTQMNECLLFFINIAFFLLISIIYNSFN